LILLQVKTKFTSSFFRVKSFLMNKQTW